jgi:hypothetical protein
VQLAGRGLDGLPRGFPRQVRGIRVGRAFRQLHLLHAAAFSVPDGTQIGAVVFHYQDGHKWETPLVYGRDVRDWWDTTDPKVGPIVAWTGSNTRSRAANARIRLFKSALPSPLPDAPVESIDLLSKGTQSAPFVVAITAE